jgi:hypothetical protein
MHVEAVGAAIHLRDARVHERDELVVEPAFLKIVLHADQGGNPVRRDGVWIQSLSHGFDLHSMSHVRVVPQRPVKRPVASPDLRRRQALRQPTVVRSMSRPAATFVRRFVRERPRDLPPGWLTPRRTNRFRSAGLAAIALGWPPTATPPAPFERDKSSGRPPALRICLPSLLQNPRISDLATSSAAGGTSE